MAEQILIIESINGRKFKHRAVSITDNEIIFVASPNHLFKIVRKTNQVYKFYVGYWRHEQTYSNLMKSYEIVETHIRQQEDKQNEAD